MSRCQFRPVFVFLLLIIDAFVELKYEYVLVSFARIVLFTVYWSLPFSTSVDYTKKVFTKKAKQIKKILWGVSHNALVYVPIRKVMHLAVQMNE